MLTMNTLTSTNSLIIELDGALDSVTGADFKAWIEEKMLAGYTSFALDCTRLDYISSRGIGSLMETQMLLENRDGSLALFALSSEVRNLFLFLKLQNKIPLHNNLDDALNFLKKFAPNSSEQTDATGVDQESVPVSSPVDSESANIESESRGMKTMPAYGHDMVMAAVPPRPGNFPADISAAELKRNAPEIPESQPPTDLEPVTSNQEKTDSEISQESRASNQSENNLSEPNDMMPTEYSISESGSMAQPSLEPQVNVNIPGPQASSGVSGLVAASESSAGESRIIPCNNCGTNLRITRPGKYLCPNCRYTFRVRE